MGTCKGSAVKDSVPFTFFQTKQSLSDTRAILGPTAILGAAHPLAEGITLGRMCRYKTVCFMAFCTGIFLLVLF